MDVGTFQKRLPRRLLEAGSWKLKADTSRLPPILLKADPPIDERDTFGFEPLSLGFAVGVGDPALAVDDPVPGEAGAGGQAGQDSAHQPGLVWHAGHGGDLAVGGDLAQRDQVDHLPDPMFNLGP